MDTVEKKTDPTQQEDKDEKLLQVLGEAVSILISLLVQLLKRKKHY